MKLESDYCSGTAVLLFAQSENKESISKPITCQDRQNIVFWRKMNERALKTIKKTNLPFFISDEACQKGKTFGDKLAGAISKVFAKGYDKVIVIGNDCPNLKCSHLLEAVIKLKTADVVLGADFKGGVYLIGVSKVAFNTKVFSTFSWQTCTVFKELRLYFNNYSCSLLPRLNDFNRSSDLKDVLKNLSFSDSIRSLLLSLTQENTIEKNNETFLVSSDLSVFNYNKGSPLIFNISFNYNPIFLTKSFYPMKQFFIWALLCVTTFVTAQEDLTVSVIDFETKKPVSSLIIQLSNTSRNLSWQQTTNTQGKVIFRNIPVLDGYQVFFEGADGYKSERSDILSVRSNQNPNVILILKKVATQELEEVVVSSSSTSKINRRDAEVSFEMKASEIQEIPVEGRDITRVLYRLPNVSQATGFYPEAPNVSINGTNGLFTSYLIDGMDNNERFLGGQKFAIPSGFVKDITVLTSNFSAEYGLTGSGVVDVTPRSGSNKMTGETFFITRPGPSIDGSSDFAQRDLSGNQVKDGFARYQAGAGIGGAFVKDKTFYYFNFEHTTDIKDNLLNVPAFGITETVRGNNTFNYFSAKIDQNWTKSFRSSLRANVGLVDIERQGGGLEGGVAFPSSANTQKRNSVLLALKNSYSFGKISGETNVQYSRFNWDYANPLREGGPQVVVLGTNDETLAILGHPGYLFNAIENTVQLQQKFKYYLDQHTFKAGLNYIRGDHELYGGGNPNGNYTVKLTQSQIDAINTSGVGSGLDINDIPANATVTNYNVELRPDSFGTHQDIYSAYVEDLWSVTDKLNITLGLRYDYDNLSKGGSNEGDYDNLAPRFNFNYKLTNNSSIRGGYAIAYDKINYAVYSDALQQNTKSADYRTQLQQFISLGILPSNTNIDAITFNGNISANLSGVTYLNGPSGAELQSQREGAFSNERRILNPNGYDNPYSHQFVLGYQLQADENKLFFVDLVHNRGENLFRLRNLNAAAEYVIDPDNVIIRTPEEADATRPIPIVNGAATINGNTVTGVARNVVMSETEGKSRYYALSLNYQKARGNDNYSYRLNYTLSSLKNDTEDINFRAMDGNNYGREWGYSINDRTHNINGIYSYYPFKGSTITLAGLLQSGQPINRIPIGFGTTDLNGDGSGFSDAYQGNSDRYPGEGRNNDRLPWSTTFDIGLQHQFQISGSHKLELRADVFNVFNAENLSGYSNNATQSNQIQGGSSASGLFTQRNASPPRQFQFGIRYLF